MVSVSQSRYSHCRLFGLGLLPVLFGLLLTALAPQVLAQNNPVLKDGGFTETVLNEAGEVNVSVVDGVGFGPNDHGHRITNTFLANTGRARLQNHVEFGSAEARSLPHLAPLRALMSRQIDRSFGRATAELRAFLLFEVYRPVWGANHLIH